MRPKRVLVVGGVAGGASCAARLRRLDEQAEIVVFEKGPYPSFANCGLPYYIGDAISDEAKLLVATPELFRDRFNIEVRTEHEVLSINRGARKVEVKDLRKGSVYQEAYDALLLSPGAVPARPPLPGVDLAGVFTLRTIPDSRAIRAWIQESQPRNAAVVGGGFIGLEMAENLARRGLKVTIVEMFDQVMPPLDREMAEYVYVHLLDKHVSVRLADAVVRFNGSDGRVSSVETRSGARIQADMVILSVGVKPETKLAKDAGLELGPHGGIHVDESMRTSDPCIWAVGDAVEVRDAVTGGLSLVPLAGPANRQGRIAADAICGRPARFRGVQATAVCGVFGLTVAMTGVSEKRLLQGKDAGYAAVYLHPNDHASYYPGASEMHLKLILRRSDGRVLGAQAVGGQGVERRIDVISFAIQKGSTVFDLEEAELCYAPQFGMAKDPVNLAGMVAANVVRGDVRLAKWGELADCGAFLVDVREEEEFRRGSIDDAINIPLDQLRQRLSEIPNDRPIWVNCARGQRSYYAVRILQQYGFDASNLSGGYNTWEVWYPEGLPSGVVAQAEQTSRDRAA
ncbi:FAD-dependent pyridine nucleotide-disulphide oxidoreductase [Acidobacteriia bacterium SbA2]|nr:FAD-dependent pyridine nucleotide-disulphide oxidoreductase [Acidobacteriia bacterium SbA2]